MKTKLGTTEIEFDVDIDEEKIHLIKDSDEWMLPINDKTILSFDGTYFWWEIIGLIKTKLDATKEDITNFIDEIEDYIINFDVLFEVKIKSLGTIDVMETMKIFKKRGIRIIDIFMTEEIVSFNENINVLTLTIPEVDLCKVKKIETFSKSQHHHISRSKRIMRKIDK